MNRSDADNILEGPFAMLTLRKAGLADDDIPANHETVTADVKRAVAECRAGGIDDATIVELLQSNANVYNIAGGSLPMDEWMT